MPDRSAKLTICLLAAALLLGWSVPVARAADTKTESSGVNPVLTIPYPTTSLQSSSSSSGTTTSANAKSPLQVDIPTVKFSDALVVTTGDAQYINIPWLAQYIAGVYKYAVAVGAFLATVMVIVGGFIYLTAGESGRVQKAKTIITDAVLGLVVLLGSYVLLYTVNPDLTALDALEIQMVKQQLYEGLEPAVDGAEGVPSINCSQPGAKITSLDSYNPNLAVNRAMSKTLQRFLTPSRVAMYRNAAKIANVPWEMLAAIHFKEGNGRGSAANGKELCNTRDDKSLLSYCPECNTKTEQNDIICAAKHLARKVSLGQNPSVDAIKTAFCRYNGCYGSYNSCPEGHPYVATYFDGDSRTSKKQTADCVPIGCKTGCTADVVNKKGGKTPGAGCCSIRVYDAKHVPSGYNPGGSSCNSVITSACITNREEGGTIITYTYNPNERTKSNPCGSWTIQSRAGALNAYAEVLRLEKTGVIQ